MRKHDKQLAQLVKRIYEKNYNVIPSPTLEKREFVIGKEHWNGPLLQSVLVTKQFEQVKFKSWHIRTKFPNNCVSLNDGNLVIIKNLVINSDNRPYILGKRYLNKYNFFTDPLESSRLGIYRVVANQLSDLEIWPLHYITRKLIHIFSSDGDNVVFPLLHQYSVARGI